MSRISSPGRDIGVAPTARHQVDPLGRAGGEDHLLARGRVDERADLLARFFVQVGALIAQPVDAAMDVGVVLFVDVDQRLNHLPRPLRGGGVVEIDQRHVVVQPQPQDRENRARSVSGSSGNTGASVLIGFPIVRCRAGRRASMAWRVGRPSLRQRRVNRRLQHAPRQQAAFLPVGRQLRAEQPQHVLGRELLDLVDVLPIEMLDQHRGRRLADAAAVAVEIDFLDLALRVDGQVDAHHVAAQRIVVLVRVRRVRDMAAMIRILVMLEDVSWYSSSSLVGMRRGGQTSGRGESMAAGRAFQVWNGRQPALTQV